MNESPAPGERSSRLVAKLLAAARRNARSPAEVELLETHISWVLLADGYAYKIKKPVELPFLDFSTLEARRFFCDEELRLNRRLAPEIYLAVVPIGYGAGAEPRFEQTPAVEYAVKMRRFPSEDRLDRKLDEPRIGAALARFAERLGRFHTRLPPAERANPAGTAEAVAELARSNVAELADCLGAQTAPIPALASWTDEAIHRLAPEFHARRAAGWVREGHGDLHLENLAYIGTEIVAFDALEFAAGFRWGDVIAESAFLVMDLIARDRSGLAFEFLDRYLATTGDYRGVAVLRFYLVYRALVRAKAGAIRATQQRTDPAGAAQAYLGLAAALARPGPPMLLVTHGLSGSGKTHVTNELLQRLPAIRVRSDIERKRLGGQPLEERRVGSVGEGLYTQAATARTYGRLGECADAILRAGFTAIVDAACLRKIERHGFTKLAAQLGVRCKVLDCNAPTDILRKRIRERAATGRDASEATEAVLDQQLATAEPIGPGESCDLVTVMTDAACDYGALAAALKRN